MHNYLVWLLCSPLEGPVRHTFQSETTNRRWQLAGIYVLCACMHEKEPQDSFRACKISNFLGACPQTPSHNPYCRAPLLYLPWAPPSSGQPWSQDLHKQYIPTSTINKMPYMSACFFKMSIFEWPLMCSMLSHML